MTDAELRHQSAYADAWRDHSIALRQDAGRIGSAEPMTDAERRYADLQGAYEAAVALARFLRDAMERAGPADEEKP